MKRLHELVLMALAAAAIAGTPVVVLAQPEEEGISAGNDPPLEEIENHVGRLGLTKEQQEKLDAQRLANRRKTRELNQKLQIKRLELKLELDKTETDKEKIDDIASEMKKLQGELVDQRVNNILELKGLLTPEQYEKLRASSPKGKRGRRGMGQGRQEGGPGRGPRRENF